MSRPEELQYHALFPYAILKAPVSFLARLVYIVCYDQWTHTPSHQPKEKLIVPNLIITLLQIITDSSQESIITALGELGEGGYIVFEDNALTSVRSPL